MRAKVEAFGTCAGVPTSRLCSVLNCDDQDSFQHTGTGAPLDLCAPKVHTAALSWVLRWIMGYLKARQSKHAGKQEVLE